VEGIPRLVVVRLAIISEGLILAVGGAWIALADLSVPVGLNLPALAAGVGAVVPLLLLNALIFHPRSGGPWSHPVFGRFRREIIEPLCRELTPPAAGIVAITSGVAEEVLFRGALLTALIPPLGAPVAVLVSSVLFAWVHFVTGAREFLPVLLVYIGFGVVLGVIYLTAGGLAPVIVTHALYNFITILLIRRDLRRRAAVSPSSNATSF